MDNNFKRYILFWLSQSASQLGSSMTGFALILWLYTKNGSAMTVSLLSFFNYLPYIVVSLFAGAFVDRHSKKKIMLAADSVAAACSLAVLILSLGNRLLAWHIYVVNFVIGFMNAFQNPASSVAMGMIVPEEKLAQVSGMNSFSGNLITVISPVLSASLFAFGGLKILLMIDLGTFLLAFLVLLLVIKIPDKIEKLQSNSQSNRIGKCEGKTRSMFAGCMEGFDFLKRHKGIFMIILTMALLNFFSRLTYENILSPMVLSRSQNNSVILGIVNAAMGIGGILGGLIVASGRFSKNSVKMIYVSAALSFLLGDVVMGLGRNVIFWAAAGVAASLPIPFINAGQNVIFYKNVPTEMQGRVFAVRNALQFSTIPLGILLGGFLADYVFEPFMAGNSALASFLCGLTGGGAGSGMAVMFLCTGISGGLFSMIFYHQKEVKDLQ